MRKVPQQIEPGSGYHSQLLKLHRHPETGRFNSRVKATADAALEFMSRYIESELYRAGLISFNDYRQYDMRVIDVVLTANGREALRGLEQGMIWNVGAEIANIVQTRHYWKGKLSKVTLTDIDVEHIGKLPQPEFNDIKGLLTYYIMTSEKRAPVHRLGYFYVQVSAILPDGSIDHPRPGR